MAQPDTHSHRGIRARSRFGEPPASPARTPADAAPPSAATWRDQVRFAAALNVLAGLWLIIAPFVLGYGDGDPYWNDIVFGAIVLVLAGARLLFAQRQAWISWLNVLIGAWVFASAFWLDDTARAAWNDVILGVIVFVLGLVAVSATRARPARA